jgi:hypothetical protein
MVNDSTPRRGFIITLMFKIEELSVLFEESHIICVALGCKYGLYGSKDV